jgi:hypothetical protein
MENGSGPVGCVSNPSMAIGINLHTSSSSGSDDLRAVVDIYLPRRRTQKTANRWSDQVKAFASLVVPYAVSSLTSKSASYPTIVI